MRGKITKQDLSESLIEEIENSTSDVDLSNYTTKEELQEAIENVDVSDKQDKTDDSLLTNDKSLVGAINELFQSANNGKQLIANAIGEPLSAEDTFSAMSTDINSLLSTFKTNMMNNGVTVESGDKFKSLIDKIATMVEEGSGKGIQFVSGSIDNVEYNSQIEIDSLNFKPFLVYTYAYISGSYEIRENICLHLHDDSIFKVCGYANSSTPTNRSYTYINGSLFDGGFQMSATHGSGYYTYYWYAIGVGEEDTTLRDSLASILTEEGVEVSEEEDMASLITKVDEEFDRQVVPEGTAVASDVLASKTFINSTGNLVTGSMTNQGSKTITPKSTKQTLAAGYYSGITINGDTKLKAANIVEGVTIFGVTGTAKTGGYYFNSDNTGVAEVTLFQDNEQQTYREVGTWTTLTSVYTSAIEGRVKFVFNATSGNSTVRLKKISGSTTTYPAQTTVMNASPTIYSLTVDIAVGDKIQLEVNPSEGYPFYKYGVTIVTTVCEY